MVDLDWVELDDDMGDAGPPGTGLTEGEKTNILNRLTTLEGNPVPVVLEDLDNVDLTGIVAGDLLRYDGINIVKHTPTATTIPFGIPIIIDGGGAVITTGVKIRELFIGFDCTITGWTIASDQSGSIVVTVSRATYAAFPTFTEISGSEKPTLSGASKNQDLDLTTWTPAIAAGSFLRFNVDSATTVTRVGLTLHATRTL